MKFPSWIVQSRLRPAACLVIWMICPGCGQKDYEERLQKSQQFYEYLQSVEDHLSSPAWNRPDVNLSMRLPKPFLAPMAGPEVFQAPDGEVMFGPDPRQENVLGMRLPGLIDGWSASIDSDPEHPDAWIYVMTNHDRFQDAAVGGPPTEEFLTDLENDLMRVFQVTIPEGETSQVGDNIRFRQLIPSKGSSRAQYTSPKDYNVIRFVPDPEFSQADLAANLYERKEGDIEAAVLVVTRKSTSAQFRQRLDMALETLEVGDQKPLLKKPGAASGGSPSSKSRNNSQGF